MVVTNPVVHAPTMLQNIACSLFNSCCVGSRPCFCIKASTLGICSGEMVIVCVWGMVGFGNTKEGINAIRNMRLFIALQIVTHKYTPSHFLLLQTAFANKVHKS